MAKKNNDMTASSKNGGKVKNTVALKRNIYALILSIVFIVGAVLLTVLSTVLAERFPLDIDLTADKKHSMTEDNIEYIKSINKPVNIYVCLTEEEYECTSSSSYNMLYYAATENFVDYNAKNTSYFQQTVELLRKYEQYNSNIKVTFIDTAQPSASAITDNFDEYLWTTGDILVESTFEADGKEITRRTAVPFKEIYTLEAGNTDTANYESYYQGGMIENYALYGMGVGYYITENNIEYAMSASIYKVTSESTPVFLVPKSYCNAESVSSVLEGMLKSNNFTVEYTDGLFSTVLSEEKMSKYSGILMADCTSDISAEDRAIIEQFLDNGGKKGKSFIYFAGTNTYKLTNLCAFLGDWGIGFDSGILYETSQLQTISSDPLSMYLTSLKTDWTSTSDSVANKCYATSNMVPMSQLYTKNNTSTYSRTATILMRTGSNGTTTVMPLDQDKATWKPASDAVLDAFPTAILTEDASVDSGTYITSYVAAFATSKFVSSDWTQYSTVANLNFTLDVFNAVAGITDNPFNFAAKTISNETFYVNVTSAKETAIRIIFMGVIPVVLVVTGFVVWIRRRRR